MKSLALFFAISIPQLVCADNAIPSAESMSVEMGQDDSIPITLKGSDHDSGQTLTYSITENPQHGTLTGTAPDMHYQPEAGYYGLDYFSYRVNDGLEDSDAATVTIDVKKNAANTSTSTDKSSAACSLSMKPSQNSPWAVAISSILFGLAVFSLRTIRQADLRRPLKSDSSS